MSLEDEIAELIRKHSEYLDDSVDRNYSSMGDWKTVQVKYLGEMKEAERIAKETGVCVYVGDLCEDRFAPEGLREKLPILIEEFGRESVAREIAKQMSKFGQLRN